MLDPFGGAGDPKYDKPQVFKPGKGYSKLEPVVVNPPARFTNQNVFASLPKDRFVPKAGQMKTSVAPSVNDPFFSKKDPVSMDAVVPKGTIAGSPYSASQYDTLTNLTKLNQMSLSGQLKNMMPVYEESTGRIIGFKPGDAYKSVVPGYDIDGVPYAAKISALRLNMDPKKYMDMSLMDRVKNFGTEAKSMGQELTTGVGQAIDAGKQLVSNLPMMSLLSGFLESGGGEQQTTDNTGIMSNQPFLYTDPTSLGGPTEKGTIYAENRFVGPGYALLEGQRKGIRDYTGEGMSDEMRAYFMSLDPAGREAFLLLSRDEKEEQMKGAKNLPFLGQYSV